MMRWGMIRRGYKDLLKLEFGCNNNQRDGACDDAKESDGFHRCIEFVLRIIRWWERRSVPCGRGRRVRGGWGVFSRTLRDIYSKCRCMNVDFVRMDGSMFPLIFLILDRWGLWVDRWVD